MRIEGNVRPVQEVYTKENKVSKVENTNKVSGAKDDIKISSAAKDYAFAMKAVKDVPDVRQDRVDEVSAKLEKGDYKVSGDEIAKRIFGEV